MLEAKVIKGILKNKKLMIVVAAAAIILLALLLLFFFRKMADPAPVEVASTESSVPEVTIDPITVKGTNINRAGICVIIPSQSGIEDPNIPEGSTRIYRPVTTFSNGSHSEVALHFADNVIALDTMTVLYLQAFDIGETPLEYVTYEVEAGAKTVQPYSYADIADKILYSADGKVILDVTFAAKKTPRTVMEEYIAAESGKELGHTSNSPLTPQNLLADGTYVYKYDWMPSAFDYVSGHIKEMLVPVRYATPYSLEELGYTFDIGSAVKNPPYLAAVSGSTIKAEGEGTHSGAYTTVVYGGERLLGNYTVLQPTYVAGGDAPSNPSSFALLQAFKRTELAPQDAGVKFLRRDNPKTSSEDYFKTYSDGPFSVFSLSPEVLGNYIVFSDENIVVYNFFDFSKAPVLEEQLKRLSETDGYEQYGIKTDGVGAARRSLLEAEGGLGRYIHKK